MIRHQTDVAATAMPSLGGDPQAAESARIIIVDDDPGLRELLTEFLVDHGLRAEAAENGAGLRARLSQRPCDLIVLDMMMPGEDGLSVLRSLPQGPDAPGVIMFSALAGEVDRVVALELGADDYVTKPSSPREILARIRSVLRRRGGGALPARTTGGAVEAPAQVESYGFAGWTLNVRLRTLNAPNGVAVRLTEGEFRLLSVFVSQPRQIYTREDMIERSGREERISRGRTIDVKISRLRRKLLEFDGAELIRTVRGNGYFFLPDVTAA